jgi:hypothetical protein
VVEAAALAMTLAQLLMHDAALAGWGEGHNRYSLFHRSLLLAARWQRTGLMPARHRLIKAVGAYQLDRRVEQMAEPGAGEDF